MPHMHRGPQCPVQNASMEKSIMYLPMSYHSRSVLAHREELKDLGTRDLHGKTGNQRGGDPSYWQRKDGQALQSTGRSRETAMLPDWGIPQG